ncbi:MAG: hypothetical protein ABFD60_07785 [Bryobacteraceae bacterium]
MASKTHPLMSNFTAGEWSPRLYGRADLGKYFNACKRLENFVIQPQGGVSGRVGTHFVAEVKYSDKLTRVLPFRFSSTQNYILEVGEYYIRLYANNGRVEVVSVPVEIATPYTEDEIFELQISQSADTLILTHPSHAQRQLVRYSHTQWRLNAIDFDPPASREFGTRSGTGNCYLVPSATTGTNIQFDSGEAIFLSSDIGRDVVASPGRATIATVDSLFRVHANIIEDFASTDQISAGNWHIDGSPQTTCTPNVTGPVNGPITLTLSVTGWRLTPITDIGKYVKINDGIVQITAWSSSTVVTGVVKVALSGVGAAPADSWSLEESAWTADNGYPRAVEWFQGRLLFGGTSQQPRTWWESSAFDPYNFAIGSNDDDAMAWTVDTSELNVIQWLRNIGRLAIGTAGGEHSATGGNDSAITPTNTPVVTPVSQHGSGDVPPLTVTGNVLFTTASGKQLREMAYRYDLDRFFSPDLLLLAEHLTHADNSYWIIDMVYQAEPDGIVWCVRSDGTLLGCTYLRDQEVVGWQRHITDGAFESVAVIPDPDQMYDQLWCVVRRTINGSTKRYIEYFDATWDVYDGVSPGVHTDSCLTLASPTPVTAVSGLDHLEGKTVKVIGDGAIYPDATVSSGAITLSGVAASNIEVGLAFTPVLQTMAPEVKMNEGTSQGLQKSWSKLKVRFKDTMGATVNNEVIPWRSSSDPLDEPPPLYTGDKDVTPLGWDEDGSITITQTQPLPINVLMITGNLIVGE